MRHLLLAGLASVLSLVAQPTLAGGGFDDGNALYRNCTSDNAFDAGLCTGYVTGVADTLSTNDIICLAEGVNKRQIKDIVIEYLRSRPAKRHTRAADHVTSALLSAFPCSP